MRSEQDLAQWLDSSSTHLILGKRVNIQVSQ